MNLDYEGVEQNFTVLDGESVLHEWRFVRDGETFNVSDVTFDGIVTSKTDGEKYAIAVSHDEDDPSVLQVIFPSLKAGEYKYEIRSVADDGTKSRIVFGALGVMNTSIDLSTGENEDRESRVLMVRLPEEASGHLMLEWRATTAALMAARRAERAQKNSEESAENATQSAQNALQAAESAGAAAQEAAQKATELAEDAAAMAASCAASAEDYINRLKQFIADWNGNITNVMWVDAETKHLIIGGHDTMCRVAGTAGKSPYIGADGNWCYYDDATEQWIRGIAAQGEHGKSPYIGADGNWYRWDDKTDVYTNTSVRAYGIDGIDGDTVRRIKVNSFMDIPQDGDTCNGGYFYYVPWIGDWVQQGESTKYNDYISTVGGLRIDCQDFPAGNITAIRIYIQMSQSANNDPVYMGIWGQSEDNALELKTISKNSLGGDIKNSYYTGWFEWQFDENLFHLGEGNVPLYLSLIKQSNLAAPSYSDVPIQSYIPVNNDASLSHNVLNGRGQSGNALMMIGVAVDGADHTGEYDVYAWLQDKGGNGEWTRVDTRLDFASSRVAGIVKYATDLVCNNGAPVAPNSNDQMTVPPASTVEAGSVVLSEDTIVEGDGMIYGGSIGQASNGKIYTRMATPEDFGSTRASWNGTDMSGCVGVQDDGSLGIAWAGLDQAGVVRLGSKFSQTNPIPYQQGVGVTSEHKLTNNLVYGGAIQHKNPTAWANDGMDWLRTQMDASPAYFGDMFYLGLLTSEQFRQSQNDGLTLLSASVSMLSGVYLAQDMSDARENAVPNPSQITSWVQNYSYSKTETYTRAEADSISTRDREYTDERLIQYSTTEETQKWTQDVALAPYVRTATLQANYYTKTQVDELYDKCMKVNRQVQDVWVCAQSELPDADKQVKGRLYITYTED